MAPTPAPTGLILTGGGARAAYQVGVLEALRRLRAASDAPPTNPFPIICGTSAGAINAAALAGGADDIDQAIRNIVDVWQNFRAEQVYRTDAIGVVRSGARWLSMMSLGWVIARWRRLKPRSLLDNEPLSGLLTRLTRLERVPGLIRDGHLHALAVSASSYSSGQHITFYDAASSARSWVRSQRRAVCAPLQIEHLLASSAIPFVFPSVALPIDGGEQWFGDGSMRQVAPISPAVHLGAQRVLVIGAGRMHEPPGALAAAAGRSGPPSIAQIAGHALSNIFLDALAVDVERLQRINATLKLLNPSAQQQTSLRPIDVLVIAPSQRLDDIAARHLDSLPPAIRALLRALGSGGPGDARSAALASYLLFESNYTRELMALGEADTLARQDEVMRFFGWRAPLVSRPAGTAAPAVWRGSEAATSGCRA